MIRGNVCRRGFVHCLADVGRLPAITIEATELPKHVLALLDHLLDLGGATAIRTRATPSSTTRYEHDQGAVEIVVSNRLDGYNCHPRVSLWRSRPPGYITRLGGSRDGAPREREFR